MDKETYSCSNHLDLHYIIGAITFCLNNNPTNTELSDKVLKAERRRMQLVVHEIQNNWSEKAAGKV